MQNGMRDLKMKEILNGSRTENENQRMQSDALLECRGDPESCLMNLFL